MPAHHAQVIATYSRRMRLRLDDGNEVDARIKGKRMRPVCGDRVSTEPIPNEDDWLITSIAERVRRHQNFLEYVPILIILNLQAWAIRLIRTTFMCEIISPIVLKSTGVSLPFMM